MNLEEFSKAIQGSEKINNVLKDVTFPPGRNYLWLNPVQTSMSEKKYDKFREDLDSELITAASETYESGFKDGIKFMISILLE